MGDVRGQDVVALQVIIQRMMKRTQTREQIAHASATKHALCQVAVFTYR